MQNGVTSSITLKVNNLMQFIFYTSIIRTSNGKLQNIFMWQNFQFILPLINHFHQSDVGLQLVIFLSFEKMITFNVLWHKTCKKGRVSNLESFNRWKMGCTNRAFLCRRDLVRNKSQSNTRKQTLLRQKFSFHTG